MLLHLSETSYLVTLLLVLDLVRQHRFLLKIFWQIRFRLLTFRRSLVANSAYKKDVGLESFGIELLEPESRPRQI